MNKERKTNLIISLAMVIASIISFIRGKTFLGIAGAVLAVWFIVLFMLSVNNEQ